MERIAPEALGLGKLFHTIRDAVIVGDPQTGIIILWNVAAARIFGYTPEEAIGSPMEMLVPDSLKGPHRDGLRRYAGTGHGVLVDSGDIVELPAIRKDGTEIFIELSLTPIEGQKLSGRFAMAVIRDVTEKKRRSEELERVNTELRAVNQAMKDFVAAASHDLRSPITTILGFATALTKTWETATEGDKLQYLEAVERQAHQLSRLVDDLLTTSQVEAGAMTVHKTDVNVENVVGRAIEFYSDTSEIDVSVQPGLTVHVDPDHLHRVIANLVGNAIRYGSPPVAVTAVAIDDNVEIKVTDRGQGVPEEFVPRLFEKFARADTEVTRREKGSGLGLSIVRGLAEANGAEVWYERLQPQGSCFTVRLKQVLDPAPAGGADAVKVLAVVEDDPDVRTLVRLHLSAEPRFHILAEVASAEEAVALAQKTGMGLGLVVLDHSLMGPLTGLEAAPLIKEAAPNAKIILFTAHDHLRTGALASPAVDAFLLKTGVHELLDMARRLTGLSS